MSDQEHYETNYTGVYPADRLADATQALEYALWQSNNGYINLITPNDELHMIPAMRAVSIVRIEPAPDALYPLPGGGGGSDGIKKTFLDALARAAQLRTVHTERVDDGTVDAVWEYEVTVVMPDLVGGSRSAKKRRLLDLREGAPETMRGKKGPMSAAQMSEALKHGPSVCESKAQNRAVRECLGIKGSIPPDQYNRPWIIFTLVPHVVAADLSQAAKDAIGIAAATGGSAADIYARAPRQAAPVPEQQETTEAAPSPPPSTPPADTPPASNPTPPTPPKQTGRPPQGKPPGPPPSGPPKSPPSSAKSPEPPAAPANRAGAAAADAEQVDALRQWYDHLGQELYQAAVNDALGQYKKANTMTSTEAGLVLQACAKRQADSF